MDMMDVLRTVFAVLAALALIVALVSIQAGEAGEPGGIKATLGLLAAGGTLVGAIISQVLEDYEWFQNLTSSGREIVVKVMTFGLPFLAAVVLQFLPAEIPAPFNQVWGLLVLAAVSFLGSQVYHAAVKERVSSG